jgi:hypothetical protein
MAQVRIAKLPVEVEKELEKESRQTGLSYAAIARQALSERYNNKKNKNNK